MIYLFLAKRAADRFLGSPKTVTSRFHFVIFFRQDICRAVEIQPSVLAPFFVTSMLFNGYAIK
ncbi:hypothetical protein HT747_06710 [Brevibacillus borstelensis]|uniref:hypothetical protein n=1 Tax=Brevibacillus TaxID=55080 RepID=UPI0015629F39|nr:hypothetical protein [Brevibacillus borstelensis]MBE5394839.1 hypothetical protein [Brevibacillus borstelensis]